MASNAAPSIYTLPDYVDDDTDLPDPLNTITKQERRAKILAAAHTGKKALSVHAPSAQGFFSRTRIVKLVGGDKVVIQFRIQPLDLECFTTARRLFGVVVPEITQLHDEELHALGIRVFAMSFMPGRCWLHLPTAKTQARVLVARSLGTILRRGSVGGDSTEVVENYILPCLTGFLNQLDDTTICLQSHVERLIAASEKVKQHPLYFSHHDLNGMNVLVGDDHTVSGIVDWECSRALPFGMGLHRVTDTIVAENYLGCIDIPDRTYQAEKAFWDAVLDGAPSVVKDNLEIVQDAIHIGALMFAITETHLPPSEFLLGELTYRMPQLRGDADPFAEEHMPTQE